MSNKRREKGAIFATERWETWPTLRRLQAGRHHAYRRGVTIRWKFVETLSPFLRALPPFWRVRAYHRLAGKPFENGGFAGRSMRRRVAPHRYVMSLDLDDWMERLAAFLGIFYEIEVTETLTRLLRPGTTFIDIGGNLGFVSLTASHLCGPEGHVVYIEPNKALADRFRATLAENGIENVAVIEAAFGRAAGTATLGVANHHGTSTIVESGDGALVALIDETAITALIAPDRQCFIKIDIEGYELEALSGMPCLLARANALFLIEVTDAWLRANGGSAVEMWRLMKMHGYEAFLLGNGTSERWSDHKLEAPLDAFQYDVLFARPAELP